MWPLNVFLIGVTFFIWGFVGFSLKKQYRYATQLFDMLILFPILVLLSLFTFNLGLYIWLDITSRILAAGISGVICLILFYYSLRWTADYLNMNYRKFLENIDTEQFSVHSFEDYVNERLERDRVNVIIRHDVDLSLKRTKKMVDIEKQLGIRSTYFFRLHAEKYSFQQAIPIIEQLSNEGFEIGLHYETLSVAKGNRIRAIELLTHDIEKLRKIAHIGVVAAHGQREYKNREIWVDVDRNQLQVSSAYDMKSDMYLSDAGGKPLRNKDGKYLFDRIYEAKPGQIVQVLIHPDWWI